MTQPLDPTDSLEHVCEYEEDALIPLQEERFRAVVREMVKSCDDEHTIDNVGEALIPSKDEIIRVLDVLNELLFPG